MQKTTTFFMFVGEQFGKAEEAIHFSAKYGWVTDKYGLSWQLKLARK